MRIGRVLPWQQARAWLNRRHGHLLRCEDCHETYWADPAWSEHDEREDGTFCGGWGRPVQAWESS